MLLVLRLVLGLLGLAICFIGLNVGLGGIATLGWQVDPGYVTAVDADLFAVQDSHTRFLGGVWFSIGLLFIAGALKPLRFAPVLFWICCLITLAGLFRLSAPEPAIVMDGRIIGSFALELIGFPLLAIWLRRVNHIAAG